jgi:hypothetical protein
VRGTVVDQLRAAAKDIVRPANRAVALEVADLCEKYGIRTHWEALTLALGMLAGQRARGEPAMNHKMGPLAANHPLVSPGESCAACRLSFQEGDYVTLVPLGPGDDPKERDRARYGRPYNAVAVAAHWACVTGEIDEPITRG